MKSRHKAALALVGWYLMTPPLGPTKCSKENPGLSHTWSGNSVECQAQIESQAPLRKWTRVPDTQEFEYKTDCERAISDGCRPQVEDDGKSYLEGGLCNAMCVAADDPRLKSNSDIRGFKLDLGHPTATPLVGRPVARPP